MKKTPRLAITVQFSHSSGHRNQKLHFPAATPKLDWWRLTVDTPHLFRWQEGATDTHWRVKREEKNI
jgi:hypothetical protein